VGIAVAGPCTGCPDLTAAMRLARLRPLVLLLWLPGCHTWARHDVAPGTAPGGAVVQGRVRATRADGSVLDLVRARVDRDTLRGELYAAPRQRPSAVAVPLDSVRRLDARRFSVRRSAALGVGLVGTWLVLLLALLSAAGPGLP
jgi:hypothetical protein